MTVSPESSAYKHFRYPLGPIPSFLPGAQTILKSRPRASSSNRSSSDENRKLTPSRGSFQSGKQDSLRQVEEPSSSMLNRREAVEPKAGWIFVSPTKPDHPSISKTTKQFLVITNINKENCNYVTIEDDCFVLLKIHRTKEQGNFFGLFDRLAQRKDIVERKTNPRQWKANRTRGIIRVRRPIDPTVLFTRYLRGFL